MARSDRLKSWSLDQHQDGSWELSHGHRTAYTGLSTRHAALQALAGAHRPGEKVFETETDGYQTEITDHLIRRQVISGRPSQATRGNRQRPAREQKPQRLQLGFVTAFGARRPTSTARDPGKG